MGEPSVCCTVLYSLVEALGWALGPVHILDAPSIMSKAVSGHRLQAPRCSA